MERAGYFYCFVQVKQSWKLKKCKLAVFMSEKHNILENIFSFLSKREPQIITLMKQTFLSWKI